MCEEVVEGGQKCLISTPPVSSPGGDARITASRIPIIEPQRPSLEVINFLPPHARPCKDWDIQVMISH